MIILEQDEDMIIWIDETEFKNQILEDGKTALQGVKDDIASGKNTTGHAKYRKILKDNGIISDAELSEWRSKIAVIEKPNPFF